MLHHEFVRPESGTPSRSFLFLHGILGSGTNLRSIARALVRADASYQAVLVDLRGHGRSPMPVGPQTLEACADDVGELARALDLPVHGILGHSFGGKVAMTLAHRRDALSEQLSHVVLVDSMPGARHGGRGSENVLVVIDALEAMPRHVTLREHFIDALVMKGQTRAIASWLAMSLRRTDDGFEMAFDLPAIRALLEDYFARDLWPLFDDETPRETPRLHQVIGERSAVFDAEDRAHAARLAREGRATLDALPAGHWVHVDDPEGLVRTLVTRVATPSVAQGEVVS
jgi:pimeloyl-ACP methyl ester carboxylesterase